MVNPWVEFVKQYAKANNISYGHAIKEAGPAYHSMKKRGKSTLRGKGLDELPDVLQEKIGSYLDDKSLGSISNTNKGINRNEGIQNDLESRRSKQSQIVQAQFTEWSREVADVLREFNPTMRDLLQPWNTDYATFSRYYDKLVVVLHRHSKLRNHELLSDKQRLTASRDVEKLQKKLKLMIPHLNRHDSAELVGSNTPWYKNIFQIK